MDCRVTGEPVRNVSTDGVSVMGSRSIINGQLNKLFPDTSKPGSTNQLIDLRVEVHMS